MEASSLLPWSRYPLTLPAWEGGTLGLSSYSWHLGPQALLLRFPKLRAALHQQALRLAKHGRWDGRAFSEAVFLNLKALWPGGTCSLHHLCWAPGICALKMANGGTPPLRSQFLEEALRLVFPVCHEACSRIWLILS